ncbi:MAG: HAD family hydrolase, partial [Candidatus Neomarinimicrobiota bacterium]
MKGTGNRILALDFDGVIVDSIEECYVSGYNAYQRYINNSFRIYNKSEIDPDDFQQFKELRNFINFGKDYVFILHALSSQENISTQIDFDAFIEENEHLSEYFNQVFHSARMNLFTNHFSTWLEMNPLYPGFRSFLQHPPPNLTIYIISTKRTEFIKAIMNKIGVTLNQDNILFAAGQFSKKMAMKEILEKEHMKTRDCFFIDDQLKNVV